MSKKAKKLGPVRSIQVLVEYEAEMPGDKVVCRVLQSSYKNPSRENYETCVELLGSVGGGKFNGERDDS
jgi:hypothetical protein